MSNRALVINPDRIQRDINRLSQIGIGPSGVTRRAYTPEDREARQMVATLMEDAGLSVRVDAVGNLFGRIRGSDPALPVLMMGSHIDSVPGAGKFDGCLGVLGGIEVARAIQESGMRTHHPVEVAAFADEEGAWGSGTFGSRVFVGDVPENELGVRVSGGMTLRQLMESNGLFPERFSEAVRPYPLGGYLELHIEQGGVLDAEGVQIGVVTGIVGITRATITVTGKANHAGTTPMHMRDDALAKAAPIITYVQQEALRQGDMVATIGQIKVSPGAVNVIPGQVTMSLEMRSMDDQKVATMLDRVRRLIQSSKGADLQCGLAKRAVPMHPTVMEAILAACKATAVSHKKMHSGAGHDAMCIARVAPAGMIFVPSKNGISHQKEEHTDWEDVVRGVEVLAHSLVHLDAALAGRKYT